MTDLQALKSRRESGSKAAIGRLFLLDLSDGRVLSLNPDGSDRKILVTDCRMPDGIVVDVEAGHIYWTNMGVPNLNDGSIERADLDGQNRKTIVRQGVTFTPKQLHLEKNSGKLTSTISSPIQMHGVAKVPAKRAPALGEHNEEILEQLGFSATEIEGFRASRTIPVVKHPEVVTTGGGR